MPVVDLEQLPPDDQKELRAMVDAAYVYAAKLRAEKAAAAGGGLLRCPFCGRDDLLGVEPHPEGGFFSVRCRACGCIGPARRSESDREAWAAWNDRKTPNDRVQGPPA